MDEPFSGLDLLMLEKTTELIQKVANRDELNTIIVVTHDITAAAAVADHLWLMGRDQDATGNPFAWFAYRGNLRSCRAGLVLAPRNHHPSPLPRLCPRSQRALP